MANNIYLFGCITAVHLISFRTGFFSSVVSGNPTTMQTNLKLFALLCATLLGLTNAQEPTFTNPILDGNSADPAVLRVGDSYYLTLSENRETELTIFKSPILTSFRHAERKVAYRAPSGYRDLWASEMHEVDGQLYIYFTMQNSTHNHRMYVIKAEDPANPMGEWGLATRLLEPVWNIGSIDGTVMKHDNRLYFLWSSWHPETGFLSIYIAPMSSPTEVTGPAVLLRQPTQDWECQGGCTNEGPYFIYNRGVSYMIFSASSTWDPGYCLSYMSIENGKDPMNIENWVSAPGPVFSRNDEEDVYTTGHASFTVSPSGTETWMVYHATSNTTHIDGYRIARIEKVDWDEATGVPNFPIAHGYHHPQPVPNGQPATFTNPIFTGNSADPCVLKLGDSYYLTLSENTETELTIFKSDKLTDFRNTPKTVAYRVPEGYTDLWASEMHQVDGELYIYFTMRNATVDHRMYVIKADDPQNPMGTWSPTATRLLWQWERGAIDGTVARLNNNQLYFVFAGSHPDTGALSLFIAEMDSPTNVVGPVVLLRTPSEPWECSGGCVDEGPYFIYNQGKAFVVHSVSSTWDPGYSLTWMSIDLNKNPMDVINWERAPGPVFTRNEEESVYTTGHAAFTKSPDDSETWIVYHGTVSPGEINGFRIARIDKITWDDKGNPVFPKPHGYNHPQPVPSGQRL